MVRTQLLHKAIFICTCDSNHSCHRLPSVFFKLCFATILSHLAAVLAPELDACILFEGFCLQNLFYVLFLERNSEDPILF
jgi:hypothetical protein